MKWLNKPQPSTCTLYVNHDEYNLLIKEFASKHELLDGFGRKWFITEIGFNDGQYYVSMVSVVVSK